MNQSQINSLKSAIKSIENKLAQSHWSQTSRNVMINLKARHEAALKLLEKK